MRLLNNIFAKSCSLNLASSHRSRIFGVYFYETITMLFL